MVDNMSPMKYEVKIISVVSQDLALRDTASGFVDQLERRPELDVIVDFSGVRSISRSFAHEYQVRKERSTKAITEINVPINVRKMFVAAMDYRKEPRFPAMENMSFTQL